MALETERSSPNGASSPGPSRDIHHHRPSSPHSRSPSSTSSSAAPASNDNPSPSPVTTVSMGGITSSISSSPPLTRFEPEMAHGDTTGGGEPPPPPPPPMLPASIVRSSPLCDALPISHPSSIYLPRLPHPSPSASASPCSPSASSSSSYYAGSPPLALYHVHHPQQCLPPSPHLPYHHSPHHHLHHLPISSFVPPSPTSIVAPQAILAAGVALGGLALGADPAASTVCGWPDLSPSPARPLPHHHPNLLSHSPLMRYRPEDVLSRPRHPPVPQQLQPPPPLQPSLPFSVDNILRPAFGLRAVLEEEERGRRRFLGKEAGNGGRTTTIPPQTTPTLPPLPQLTPHKKKKKTAAEVLSSAAAATPKDQVEGHTEGQLDVSTTNGVTEDRVGGDEEDSKTTEPKLPNPEKDSGKEPMLWPAWVYCTRYSDRPSSGPRSRRVKRKNRPKGEVSSSEEKRPRTAFSAEQLSRLKQEFAESRYLTEKRRQALARDLRLNESQIKIWFQNKRAKIKKASGQKGGLALQLMAQGLYNHSTVPVDDEEEEEAAAAAAAAAAAEEEKRRQAAASMVIPSVMMGGGALPLDTRPPALLVER